MEAIARDSSKVIPLSSVLTGQYGLENVALSLPCILGRSGVKQILDLPLSPEEQDLLYASATTLKSHLDEI